MRRAQNRTSVALVGAVAVLFSSCGHPGGDPGGGVLRQLRPALSAVPPGVSMVTRHAADSSWESGVCPDNPHSGWSEVFVSATFVTPLSHQVVLGEINAVFARQGWTRHDTVATEGQGPIAHWSKRVATRRLADAFAFPVPARSEHWLITADWAPPGFTLPGC